MRKALDYFLEHHNIQQSVDLTEDNIKRGYDENIVIHHKQDLCFLHSLREFKIDNDRDALLQFIASRELSRCWRLFEILCEQGNQEAIDLIREDINFLSIFTVGEPRFSGMDTINKKYIEKHPERCLGEEKRDAAGIVSKRKPDTVIR